MNTVTLSTDEGSARITTEQFHRLANPVQVPTDENFGDNDFLPADDLEALASHLIDQHIGLGHLASLNVHYRWKRRGGKKSGAAVYGKCVKPSGLLADYSQADFVIWLAADYVRDAEFTPRQIESLLFHEMNHAGLDDNDEPVLIAHNVEMFRAEIEQYGFWSDELKSIERTVQQLALDLDDEREEAPR